MLTQLSTVKSRLALTVTDYDDLLTNAINAVSARFDKETNRTLSRTTTATHEFDATDTEILPPLLSRRVGHQIRAQIQLNRRLVRANLRPIFDPPPMRY